MNQYALNPGARSLPATAGLFSREEYDQVNHYLQGSPATSLLTLSTLAAQTGVASILLKDESNRFGLNAFKTLGVTYAIARLLDEGRLFPGSTLVCATEGNHGRAVARAARENALNARVYMSAEASPSRIDAITGEGAEIVLVAGNYDEAVRTAAHEAAAAGWTVVSDTSWPGYDEVPRLIMAGYTWLMHEAESQWAPDHPPDVVLVQAGVGGLACAVVSWLCSRFGANRPFTIVCEPAGAACVLEAVRNGEPRSLAGPFDTIMAGLRCGEVSPLTWPTLQAATDAFVAIDDLWTLRAMRMLAEPRGQDATVTAGASGACGLGTLLAILGDKALRDVCDAGRINESSRILVINTEGATDQDLYLRVTGEPQATH